MIPGRNCPPDYRYDASIFREHASTATETLYVVGGLYGNEPALDEVIRMFERERGAKHLVFNGDFNWFNIAPERFRRINELVLAYDAVRGNVETELARPVGSTEIGCGCGYPDFVDDDVVDRSNAIMERLRTSAILFPELQRDLAQLPMWRRIDVGGARVAVIHGDPSSLAGWGLGIEALSEAVGVDRAARWFDEADIDIFACTHTVCRCFAASAPVSSRTTGPPACRISQPRVTVSSHALQSVHPHMRRRCTGSKSKASRWKRLQLPTTTTAFSLISTHSGPREALLRLRIAGASSTGRTMNCSRQRFP